MDKITVAAVACGARPGDTENNLKVTEAWTKRAADAGAELVMFPEMNITGYDTGPDPCSVTRGDAVDTRLAALAGRAGVAVAAGMAWRDEVAGPLYLAHGIWLPGGGVHIYRKTHLGGREEQVYRPGSELPVFALPGVRAGIQLCLEQHFPDISQTLVLRGAQLLLVPHATPRLGPEERRSSWHLSLRARAYDNCVYLMASNLAGDNGRGVRYPGGAIIVNPSGVVKAEDFSGGEAMVTAELDLSAVIDARSTPEGMCRRFYAPYRRPELYD